jgi:hypothetical protein
VVVGDRYLNRLFPQPTRDQGDGYRSTGLACAASGKSGGFLARDWCEGSSLALLARRSFDLYAQLENEIESDWGDRRLDTYGGFASQQRLVGWLVEPRSDGCVGHGIFSFMRRREQIAPPATSEIAQG